MRFMVIKYYSFIETAFNLHKIIVKYNNSRMCRIGWYLGSVFITQYTCCTYFVGSCQNSSHTLLPSVFWMHIFHLYLFCMYNFMYKILHILLHLNKRVKYGKKWRKHTAFKYSHSHTRTLAYMYNIILIINTRSCSQMIENTIDGLMCEDAICMKDVWFPYTLGVFAEHVFRNVL